MTVCAVVNADNTLTVVADTTCSGTEVVLLGEGDYLSLQNPFQNATPDWHCAIWAWGAGILLWSIGLICANVVGMIKKAR